MRADGELDAMAGLVQDLLAKDVWHIGLYIVASAGHGRGDARAIWCDRRLGARPRRRVAAARRGPHTIGVYVEPLSGEPIQAYLDRVPRDRGDAA